MDKKIYNILNDYLGEINILEKSNLETIERAERALEMSRRTLQLMRDIIVRKNKITIKEEIYFFKKVKPKINSNLIYYTKLIEFETKRPKGSLNAQLEFLDKEIIKSQKYLNDNREFYQYYRRGGTFLDIQYFVREQGDSILNLNNIYFVSDKKFNTRHDSTLAIIIANLMFISFLQNEINKLENISAHEFNSSRLIWTANKVDLIELIYALHSSGVVNSGNAGIKEVASVCEQVFNVTLGDYYRTFLEIRSRKINQTKFIDRLKESLTNKMIEIDQ